MSPIFLAPQYSSTTFCTVLFVLYYTFLSLYPYSHCPSFRLRAELTNLPAVLLVFMPDSPTTARWASESDKAKFVERVRSNDQGIKQKIWRREQAVEAFKDPFTYLLFGLTFFNTLVVGGVNTFNSLLINKAFGFE